MSIFICTRCDRQFNSVPEMKAHKCTKTITGGVKSKSISSKYVSPDYEKSILIDELIKQGHVNSELQGLSVSQLKFKAGLIKKDETEPSFENEKEKYLHIGTKYKIAAPSIMKKWSLQRLKDAIEEFESGTTKNNSPTNPIIEA